MSDLFDSHSDTDSDLTSLPASSADGDEPTPILKFTQYKILADGDFDIHDDGLDHTNIDLEYTYYEEEQRNVFLRFIILGVLNHHGYSPLEKYKYITVDHLQIPYMACLIRSRDEAVTVMHHIKNARWLEGGIEEILKRYPNGMLKMIGTGDICSACQEAQEYRVNLYEYAVFGKKYKDDTFGVIANQEEQRRVYSLGTTCVDAFTKGHQLYHSLYNAYNEFNKWCLINNRDGEVQRMLNAKDIDGLMGYFEGYHIFEHQPHLTRTTVFDETLRDAFGRIEAHKARLEEKERRKAGNRWEDDNDPPEEGEGEDEEVGGGRRPARRRGNRRRRVRSESSEPRITRRRLLNGYESDDFVVGDDEVEYY